MPARLRTKLDKAWNDHTISTASDPAGLQRFNPITVGAFESPENLAGATGPAQPVCGASMRTPFSASALSPLRAALILTASAVAIVGISCGGNELPINTVTISFAGSGHGTVTG